MANQRSGPDSAAKKKDFFRLLDADANVAEEDAKTQANIVHGFDSHKSAVVLWLRRTGIADHIQGPKKDEIQASFALLKNGDSEPELFLMLDVMDEILLEAHSWRFDGLDCMLTWPRQLALKCFHTIAVGKARGFDQHKDPSSLKINFGYWKQFLTYCYRMVYCGGRFIKLDEDQQMAVQKVDDAPYLRYFFLPNSKLKRPFFLGVLSLLLLPARCFPFFGVELLDASPEHLTHGKSNS